MEIFREWTDCFISRHPASSATVIPTPDSMYQPFQVPTQSSARPVRQQATSCKWSQTLKIAEIRCKFVCEGNYKAAKQFRQDVQASEKCQSGDGSTRVHSSQQHKQIFTGTYSNWNLWDIINLSTNECGIILGLWWAHTSELEILQQLDWWWKEKWQSK